MRKVYTKIVSLAFHCRQIHREDLLAEYTADNPLSAEEIGYTSQKNVTWCCAYGHTETESPYNCLRRGYCKTCGKGQEGSFAQNYPEAARLWSKKNPVLPTEISPVYSKPVLWECDKGTYMETQHYGADSRGGSLPLLQK